MAINFSANGRQGNSEAEEPRKHPAAQNCAREKGKDKKKLAAGVAAPAAGTPKSTKQNY